MIPRTIIPILFALLWGTVGRLEAQDNQGLTPPPETPSDAQKTDLNADPPREEDPFWPIGYVPSNPAPARIAVSTNFTRGIVEIVAPPPPPKTPQWDAARTQLKIQGISRVGIDKQTGRPTFFAVINGRVLEEGSTIETATPDFIYRWKVMSIVEKNVRLVPLEAQNR